MHLVNGIFKQAALNGGSHRKDRRVAPVRFLKNTCEPDGIKANTRFFQTVASRRRYKEIHSTSFTCPIEDKIVGFGFRKYTKTVRTNKQVIILSYFQREVS